MCVGGGGFPPPIKQELFLRLERTCRKYIHLPCVCRHGRRVLYAICTLKSPSVFATAYFVMFERGTVKLRT